MVKKNRRVQLDMSNELFDFLDTLKDKNIMQNNIIIEIKNPYHALKLFEALSTWKDKALEGGDAYLAYMNDTDEEKMYIGHDVSIRNIEHKVKEK